MRISYILVNNHGRTVPVVHQEAGGRRDTNTECQREFVVDVTFDESLTNNEISNTRVSLINTYLLAYNVYNTLNIILPQQIFKRWATPLWIGSGCLGACLPLRNPLVDGAGDTMLHTIRDFFVIGHVLGLNMNEWVEVVAAETK